MQLKWDYAPIKVSIHFVNSVFIFILNNYVSTKKTVL